MSATAAAWFVLDIDDDAGRRATNSSAKTGGGVVVVERARGDCCGCCGPLGGGRVGTASPNGYPLAVPFLDTREELGRVVAGAIAFVGGLVSAALLVVLVWSIDSFGDAQSDAVSDLASGTGSGSYD